MPAKTKEQNVQFVLEQRRRIKRALIKGFGGKCGHCGYNRCERALEFHHLDPSEKEFTFGGRQATAWVKLVVEIKKCVMLCANCHREVHDGLIALSETVQRFDEMLSEYVPYASLRGNKNNRYKNGTP